MINSRNLSAKADQAHFTHHATGLEAPGTAGR